MHAGAAAAARHEEGPDIGDRPATGLERPLGGGVRHAIAAGLGPGRQVEPVVAGPEEELDQQAAQRSQEPQRAVSNSRKDVGAGSLEAEAR